MIVCIAVVAYQELKSILEKEGFLGSEERENIGWGKTTYDLTELRKGEQTVILVRLPHLSTYKIFSRTNCEAAIKKIADRISSMLD